MASKTHPDEYRLETASCPNSGVASDAFGHRVEYSLDLYTSDEAVFLDIYEYAHQKITEAIQNERLIP